LILVCWLLEMGESKFLLVKAPSFLWQSLQTNTGPDVLKGKLC
jgi:hypothetical protein